MKAESLTIAVDARRRPASAAGTRTLSGWGKVPTVAGAERLSEDLVALSGEDTRLARGLGRAYGDAALPAPGDYVVTGTRRADLVVGFDDATGVLRAEAGFTLDQLVSLFLPKGFFTPVSPGTRFVTLGGMVASDVHGKNHHIAGTLGQHLRRLRLRVPDGRVVTCSPCEEPELFWGTVGGMGLTGTILDVELTLVRVPSPWIFEERQSVRNIDEMIHGLRRAADSWPMTVAWIDCLSSGASLGRGVLIKGRWAEAHEAPAHPPPAPTEFPIPVEFPGFVLSTPVIRGFNAAHYWVHTRRRRAKVVHPHAFFYPLDAVRHWRRLYGSRGFVQYQCVLPYPDVNKPAHEILTLLSGGATSFLCVVKDCGPEGQGTLSFPRPGISIALDIPFRPQTQALVDAMNEVVIAAGGRIYLAKDALTRPGHFAAMKHRLPAFMALRERWDPERRLRSAQSVRLMGW